MDQTAAPVVVVAHANGLIGAGLVLFLEQEIGVPCRAVDVRDIEAVRRAVAPETRILVLECTDTALAQKVAAAVFVPVVDITGVVRQPVEPGPPTTCEALVERIREVLADAA